MFKIYKYSPFYNYIKNNFICIHLHKNKVWRYNSLKTKFPVEVKANCKIWNYKIFRYCIFIFIVWLALMVLYINWRCSTQTTYCYYNNINAYSNGHCQIFFFCENLMNCNVRIMRKRGWKGLCPLSTLGRTEKQQYKCFACNS